MMALASNVVSVDDHRRFVGKRQVRTEPINDRDDLRSYIHSLLEVSTLGAGLIVLQLGHGNQVISESWCEGTSHTAPLDPRRIVLQALGAGASAMIVVRLSSGFVTRPTEDDAAAAASLQSACRRLGIALQECVLVAPQSGAPQCWTPLI